MSIISFSDNHQGFIALLVGVLSILPFAIPIFRKNDKSKISKNNFKMSKINNSGTMIINVDSDNSNSQSKQINNEQSSLGYKEKLELELLKYININDGGDIEPKNINHIIETIQNQIDLLKSLSDKNYINIIKLVDGRERKINHFVAMNVSMTLDGRAYLEKNISEVIND